MLMYGDVWNFGDLGTDQAIQMPHQSLVKETVCAWHGAVGLGHSTGHRKMVPSLLRADLVNLRSTSYG